MKTLAMGSPLVWIALLASGCGDYQEDMDPYTPAVQAYYQAPHALRKMFSGDVKVTERTPSTAHLSGGFFLFMGGIRGDYKEGTTKEYVVTRVQFAWDVNGKTFAPLTIPIEKARVAINDSIGTPTVAFFLDDFLMTQEFHNVVGRQERRFYDELISKTPLRFLRDNRDAPQFLTENQWLLKYVVITCNSHDWPENINIAMNEKWQ